MTTARMEDKMVTNTSERVKFEFEFILLCMDTEHKPVVPCRWLVDRENKKHDTLGFSGFYVERI